MCDKFCGKMSSAGRLASALFVEATNAHLWEKMLSLEIKQKIFHGNLAKTHSMSGQVLHCHVHYSKNFQSSAGVDQQFKLVVVPRVQGVTS